MWLNREALNTVFARVELRPVLVVPPLLFLVQVVVSGLRTVVLLGPEARADVKGCVGCHIVAQVSNQLVPSGAGDFVLKGACLARRLKRPYARLAGVVLVDRLFDAILAAALIPVVLLALWGRISPAAGLGLTAVVVLVLPAILHGILHPLLTGMQSVSAGRTGRVATLANGLNTLYRERRDALRLAYLVTVLRFAAMAGGLALLHHLMFDGGTWQVVLLFAPVSQLALLLPVAPGGLGVVEGAWYGALTMAGSESATAFAFALAVRVYIIVGTLLSASLALALHGAALWRNARRDARARMAQDAETG